MSTLGSPLLATGVLSLLLWISSSSSEPTCATMFQQFTCFSPFLWLEAHLSKTRKWHHQVAHLLQGTSDLPGLLMQLGQQGHSSVCALAQAQKVLCNALQQGPPAHHALLSCISEWNSAVGSHTYPLHSCTALQTLLCLWDFHICLHQVDLLGEEQGLRRGFQLCRLDQVGDKFVSVLEACSSAVIVCHSPWPAVEQASLGQQHHVIKHVTHVAAGLVDGAYHLHTGTCMPSTKALWKAPRGLTGAI